MSEETRIEWAIDYQDGCGPRWGFDEMTVRHWLTHWNRHREDQAPALLLKRTVTASDWEIAE